MIRVVAQRYIQQQVSCQNRCIFPHGFKILTVKTSRISLSLFGVMARQGVLLVPPQDLQRDPKRPQSKYTFLLNQYMAIAITLTIPIPLSSPSRTIDILTA